MTLILPPALAALPFATPTLADALVRLRQDLFDQLTVPGLVPSRWADGDLGRAIDRALDRYSLVAPWVRTALLPAVGGARPYPVLAAPSPAGPPWWVEGVECPSGCYPRAYVPFQERTQPGLGLPAAPVAQPASGGALGGVYLYRVTFLGIAGETASSPPGLPVSLLGQAASVSLPIGPVPYCRGRALYRTAAGGADGTQLLVATLRDNTTTAYLDALPDAGLGAPLPAGDSTAEALLVELAIPDSRLPDPIAPGTLALTYASRHAWAANGTTVPGPHQDIVLLGAAAYACLAYQVPANDLFEYQDGALHDRVSEVKTPEHWLAAGNNLLAQFVERIEWVKRQRDAEGLPGERRLPGWGGVPARWGWL